jgi:hypothetical protein
VLRKLHTQIFASFSTSQGPRGDFARCDGRPTGCRWITKNFRESFIKAFEKEFAEASNSDLSAYLQ